MRITRKSLMSGTETTYDLPVTIDQMNEWQTPNRRHAQVIFPMLPAWQREFIMTGYTLEEQEMLFGMNLTKEELEQLNKQFKVTDHANS